MLIKPRGRNIFHFIDLMSWKYKAGFDSNVFPRGTALSVCMASVGFLDLSCLSRNPRRGTGGSIEDEAKGREEKSGCLSLGRDDVDTAAVFLLVNSCCCWLLAKASFCLYVDRLR